jgi:hypothetical protein
MAAKPNNAVSDWEIELNLQGIYSRDAADQVNCSRNQAKAARAMATPLIHRLPNSSAKMRRLECSPAATQNFDPKWVIV